MTVTTKLSVFASNVNTNSTRYSSPQRKPRTPSPTKRIQCNEYKVGSWGKTPNQKQEIKHKMYEAGVYTLSLWNGKDGYSKHRRNEINKLRIGDKLYMPDYKGGRVYVGTITTLPKYICDKDLMENYSGIWNSAFPSWTFQDDDYPYFRIFKVSWNEVRLTNSTEISLKRLVKDGGRCEKQCGTIIALK